MREHVRNKEHQVIRIKIGFAPNTQGGHGLRGYRMKEKIPLQNYKLYVKGATIITQSLSYFQSWLWP